MIELKVNKHEVTVTDIDGTIGELADDIADIIRYFYLSEKKAGWGGDTFRTCLMSYLVNEGGDANMDKAWAWQPQKEGDLQ